MSADIKNYMGHLWYSNVDGIITVGLNEEALEDFDEILSFDLPKDNEDVTEDEVCGSIETSDGPLDIYAPVSGTILEINSTVVEDPAVLMEDPYEEGWLIKISADEEEHDEEDEDEDDDYEDEEEDEEDEDEEDED
jgi:glycine cleavage system H protein